MLAFNQNLSAKFTFTACKYICWNDKIIEFSDSQSLLHIIFYRSANLEIAELIVLFLSIVDISDWLSYRAETCAFCKLSIVHHR